jgi:hypothetical protein
LRSFSTREPCRLPSGGSAEDRRQTARRHPTDGDFVGADERRARAQGVADAGEGPVAVPEEGVEGVDPMEALRYE